MPIKVHPSHAVHRGVWLRTDRKVVRPIRQRRGGEAVRDTAGDEHLLGGRAGLPAEMATRFEGVRPQRRYADADAGGA